MEHKGHSESWTVKSTFEVILILICFHNNCFSLWNFHICFSAHATFRAKSDWLITCLRPFIAKAWHGSFRKPWEGFGSLPKWPGWGIIKKGFFCYFFMLFIVEVRKFCIHLRGVQQWCCCEITQWSSMQPSLWMFWLSWKKGWEMELLELWVNCRARKAMMFGKNYQKTIWKFPLNIIAVHFQYPSKSSLSPKPLIFHVVSKESLQTTPAVTPPNHLSWHFSTEMAKACPTLPTIILRWFEAEKNSSR